MRKKTALQKLQNRSERLAAARAGGRPIVGRGITVNRRDRDWLKPTGLMVDCSNVPLGLESECPFFSWAVLDKVNDERQSAYQIRISSSAEIAGENVGDVWDSGVVRSAESAQAPYTGVPLKRNMLYYWRVRIFNKDGLAGSWSEPQRFSTAAGCVWPGAKAIWAAEESGGPPRGAAAPGTRGNVVFLRRDFDVASKPVECVLVSAIGKEPRTIREYTFRLYVNGRGAGVGSPRGFENGRYRHQYVTLDVTHLIREGARNAVGAVSYAAGEDKRFQLYLNIFYRDGTRQTLVTDECWRSLDGTAAYGEDGTSNTAGFPVMNENIDARFYPYGWSEPGYDDTGWLPAAVKETIVDMRASQTEPMQEHIVPVDRFLDCGNGHYRLRLEKEIVGSLRLRLADVSGMDGCAMTVLYGEALSDKNSVKWETDAGNTYRERWTLKDGAQEFHGWGIKCFRYVEITGAPSGLRREQFEGVALHQVFDDGESSFCSSSPVLNDIWELCKYTIKASNQDLYVDSHTRERTAYEGDNYIQQLSSYAVSRNYRLARYSNLYVMFCPTWPVEYRYQIILAAWEDYRYTGDLRQIRRYYPKLEEHLLLPYYDKDKGLFYNEDDDTHGLRPMIDWPPENRDGYDMRVRYNLVTNCYAYRALTLMARMAALIQDGAGQNKYGQMAAEVRRSINRYFLDKDGFYAAGMYADGTLSRQRDAVAGSIYPLLFGIPESREQCELLGKYIARRGLRGNVYTAQFQLQALYAGGEQEAALELLTNRTDKGWAHMVYDLGATMSTELFDPSQGFTFTYSHPWSSSPTNIIVRDMMGIIPLEAAFQRLQIKPQPGSLRYASLTTPTIKGSISVRFRRFVGDCLFELKTVTPVNTLATVYVPAA